MAVTSFDIRETSPQLGEGVEHRAVTHADQASALAAVRALTPGFRERAERTEQARSIAPENIDELLDAGLFNLLTPTKWGGSELGFDSVMAVQSEIAAACGSTGWVHGVLSGHTWLLSFFSEQVQREVFADPRSLVAALVRLGGTSPEAVPGGYRWRGGRGRFCSGIDHSNYVMVGGQVTQPDGTSEGMYFMLPREDVEIIDDWHTVGLRGTGSRSLHVPDAFIPEYRTVRLSDMAAGTAPGSALNDTAFYRLPYLTAWPLSLAGAPIGLAREALA
jgi:alkylation response protein AidB-like acyl-CoA dehydrogenase